jgi:glutathione S-transferase
MTELGLEWDTERVDVGRMAHKAPEYLALNPAGEVPAIRHGERVLHDSQVIAEYLDGLYGDPETRLFPRAAWPLAQVRMWMALEAGTHKELRPLWWLHVVRPALIAEGLDAEHAAVAVPAGVHPSYVSWLRDVLAGTPRFDSSPELARRRILQKLDVLERRLARAEWLVGDGFTMADLAWFARCEMLPGIGVVLEAPRHAGVLRWFERVAGRPAVTPVATGTE